MQQFLTSHTGLRSSVKTLVMHVLSILVSLGHLHKISDFVCERRKFETFRDEAGRFPGSFPVSSTAAEPNARNLTTQDSSKFLMPY